MVYDGPEWSSLSVELWHKVFTDGGRQSLQWDEFKYPVCLLVNSFLQMTILTCRQFLCILTNQNRYAAVIGRTVLLRNPLLADVQVLQNTSWKVASLAIRHDVRSKNISCENVYDFISQAMKVPGLAILRLRQDACESSLTPCLVVPKQHDDALTSTASSLKVFEFVGTSSRTKELCVGPDSSSFLNILPSNLEVFSMRHAAYLTDSDIQTVCANCPRLQCLRLLGLCVRRVTPKAFLLLDKPPLRHMKSLSLSGAYYLRDNSSNFLCGEFLLSNIMTSFPHLEQLKLGPGIDITQAMVSTASNANSRQCANLKTLKILEPCLGNEYLRLFQTLTGSRLEDLAVGGNGITDNLVHWVATNCTRIRSISLPNAIITDASLWALCKANLLHLEHFKSAWNMELTKTAKNALIARYNLTY